MEDYELMTLEKDKNFTKKLIIDRLKSKGRDGDWMITCTEFLFSQPVVMLFNMLNFKFMFTRGHPAYNRMKLYGIFMYAYTQNVYTLIGVAYLCRNDGGSKVFYEWY